MSRIRSVHPGQWTDATFLCCSPLARLLAIALRNEADDSGVFEWKPAEIKIRLLPMDNCEAAGLLAELEAADLIRPYEIGGRRFGAIRNFARYQRPKFPKMVHPRLPWVGQYVGMKEPDSGSGGSSSPPSTVMQGGSSPSPTGIADDDEGDIPPNVETGAQRKEEGGSLVRKTPTDTAIIDSDPHARADDDDPVEVRFLAMCAAHGGNPAQQAKTVAAWKAAYTPERFSILLETALNAESNPWGYALKSVSGTPTAREAEKARASAPKDYRLVPATAHLPG